MLRTRRRTHFLETVQRFKGFGGSFREMLNIFAKFLDENARHDKIYYKHIEGRVTYSNDPFGIGQYPQLHPGHSPTLIDHYRMSHNLRYDIQIMLSKLFFVMYAS